MAALVQNKARSVQSTSAHPFTCNTCQVAFRSSDLQRTHMQSDWHRYNLKRRVASLPPLTSEVFAEKVLANKATAAATAARASFEKRCDACDKSYFSEGAYVNHLGSQKHKLLAARFSTKGRGLESAETDSMADSTFTLGETLDTASTIASTINAEDSLAEEEFEEVVEGVRSIGISGNANPVSHLAGRIAATVATRNVMTGEREEEDDDDSVKEYEHRADLKQCLFCNYMSPTMELNLNHMSKQHSFFIPEQEFLIDLAGLINHLSETVTVLHECLFCHKSVHTTPGVQTHMRDRGHCMIAYSTEDEQMEIGEYYDFRSTYSDESEDEEEDATGGVSLGAKRSTLVTMRNEDGEEVAMEEQDEDGWESDSTLSSVPTDEITSVPIGHQNHKYERLGLSRHHSHNDPRPHKNSDGFHSHAHHGSNAVYYDDYELHLPSGRTAGHRSLNRYFRQNLHNYPTPEERVEQRMIESRGRDRNAEEDENAQQNGDRGRQIVTRADGGLGMVGVSETKKREVRAREKREQKRAQRQDNRYRAGNEKRGNFQKHFRDPLLQ